MCKFSDLRYAEVHADSSDAGWFATRYYSVAFNGWRGFFEEEWTSQLTTWGPELYDGKQHYHCKGCVVDFDDFRSAQLHLDEEPDENPDVLSWFGLH